MAEQKESDRLLQVALREEDVADALKAAGEHSIANRFFADRDATLAEALEAERKGN